MFPFNSKHFRKLVIEKKELCLYYTKLYNHALIALSRI